MAIFNVAFLNPKMRAKSGGGALQAKSLKNEFNDLKNELWRDGYLSAGDHDKLIDKARQIRISGTLTPSQELDWDKIISDQEREKELAVVDYNGDIERITDEIDVERNKSVKVIGNNPVQYIFSKIDKLASSINELDREIDNRSIAGMDISKYMLEKQALGDKYNEQINMLNTLDSYDGKEATYAAYIKTTHDGKKIIDIDYGSGKRSGYYEINAVIDGKFRVYAKPNYKEGGNIHVILDNIDYSAVDMLEADPENPGQFKPTKLMGNAEQKPGGPRTALGEDISILSSNLMIQQQPDVNYWARGKNGSLYQRTGDDGYIKHVNADEKDLKIEGHIMDSFDSLEQHFMKNSIETIDHAEKIGFEDEEMQMSREIDPRTQGIFGPPLPEARMSFPRPAEGITRAESSAARTRRTPQQPREQVSPGILETAKRTFQGGVDYLKSRFS